MAKQVDEIRDFLSSGCWYTIDEIVRMTSYAPQSVSARLRDLRKPEFGGHTISRRPVPDGVFKGKTYEYRMVA